MTAAPEDPLLLELAPRGPRGYVLLSWTAIVAMAVTVVYLQRDRAEHGPARPGRTDLLVMQIQARYLVGAKELVELLAPGGPVAKDLAHQADALNHGAPDQRLAAILLIGALAGPDAALERLTQFDRKLQEQEITLTPEEERLRTIIGGLESGLAEETKDASSVTPADRQLLRERFGWIGKLAVAEIPNEDATERAKIHAAALRTAIVIILAFVGGSVVGLGGFMGLVILLVRLGKRHLPPALPVPTEHGGVYAETFAVWMALYLGLSIASNYLPLPGGRLLLGGISLIISLPLALLWPRLRGIPWRTLRGDIGLVAGRNPLVELLLGFATYAMALPLMIVGLILTSLLLRLQSGDTGDSFRPIRLPSHPVVESMPSAGWTTFLQILILASVVAPIVEETMFRGLLYYHLRNAGWRLPRLTSFVLAGGAVSLLFAAIHPQGLATIPALMSLAYAFTLAREWRGTLLPSMVAHGLNNGFVMMLLLIALMD